MLFLKNLFYPLHINSIFVSFFIFSLLGHYKMEKVSLQATQTDLLTNLPNRSYMIELLEKKLSSSKKEDQKRTSLIFIEFDDLSRFNETFGFDIDDKLIVQLSHKIASLLETNDILARVGNEQFAIMSQNFHTEESAEIFAKRIIAALYEPFFIDPNMFYVSASIGISLSSADENNGYRLFKAAENTMRKVQKDGKNHIAFTRQKDKSYLEKSIRLMEDLPAAIENGDIYFVYQGQYSHDKHRFEGAELLSRWEHPKYGEISPETFILIAEQSGMIGPLTIKALIEASKMFVHLEAAGIKDFSISINISSVVLMASDFIETVQFMRSNYNLVGKKLNFEIMEETLIQNTDHLVHVLEKIREMDIGIELDDYGTGYASLKYLALLPISALKIDKSYVRDLNRDIKRQALFQAIIDMSRALDIEVIVEGVESVLEDDIVKKIGGIKVQGYLYSEPVKSDIFLNTLE
ncbi:MAG TPA: bifunctional diguanylate cyclase/phosphodiesterase [Sulfurovum sp.]|uniref:putative bifunctional diguanylate cyclase/phosphodiesterase n=1 Tax=Sulfurovum sp. TaxID=1969726 RepID=UPI002F925A94